MQLGRPVPTAQPHGQNRQQDHGCGRRRAPDVQSVDRRLDSRRRCPPAVTGTTLKNAAGHLAGEVVSLARPIARGGRDGVLLVHRHDLDVAFHLSPQNGPGVHTFGPDADDPFFAVRAEVCRCTRCCCPMSCGCRHRIPMRYCPSRSGSRRGLAGRWPCFGRPG